MKVGHKLGLDEVGKLLNSKKSEPVLHAPVRPMWPTHRDKQLILDAIVSRQTTVSLHDSHSWSPFTIKYNDKRGTAWVSSHRIDGPCGHFTIKALRNEINREEFV